MDDLSNFIADELAASGETDLAEAVRCSGDAIETAIVTAMDARACLGSVKPAAFFGAAVGGAPGAFIAGGIAALFNPSCRDALKGLLQTVDDVGDALGAVVDDIVGESQCAAGTVPAEDTLACADHCSSVLPVWCAYRRATPTLQLPSLHHACIVSHHGPLCAACQRCSWADLTHTFRVHGLKPCTLLEHLRSCLICLCLACLSIALELPRLPGHFATRPSKSSSDHPAAPLGTLTTLLPVQALLRQHTAGLPFSPLQHQPLAGWRWLQPLAGWC